MFEGISSGKELVRILLLSLFVCLIGVWSIVHTAVITSDGLFWVTHAPRFDSVENTSGTAGVSGQGYLFTPEGCGVGNRQGNSGMGISLGTNGISVYEHDRGYLPPLAVYKGEVGTGWNHVSVTYTNRQPRIYLNGKLVRVGLVSPKRNVFAPRQMGGSAYGWFEGKVSEIAVWNRPLSEVEIGASTREGFGVITNGLIGHWAFNEGSGMLAYDCSGGRYQAVLRGAAWTAHQGGYALEFDGLDDTVLLGYAPPHNNFTISAWVQTAKPHEVPVPATLLRKMQNPGLPFMISCWHQFLNRFGLGEDNRDWALAGQTLCMLCRVLALIPLYYFGKQFVGERNAFWSLLIFVFLPWPAEWGHDILREWPHLLFLFMGLLLVWQAFDSGRTMYLLPAGFLTALGYVIRPECVQILVYAMVGLVAVLLFPRGQMTRQKAASGLLLLTVGFTAIFLPYMQFKGWILPVKLEQFLASMRLSIDLAPFAVPDKPVFHSAGILSDTPRGVMVLIQNLLENHYYYFFPFMLIGLRRFFTCCRECVLKRCFISMLLLLNAFILIALYQQTGYMSRRHLLPLTAITIFFIPTGLDYVASMIARKKTGHHSGEGFQRQRWSFLVLIGIGVFICMPKLMSPPGEDHLGLRKAGDFLRENTSEDIIVAVPDARVVFYAERHGIIYASPLAEGEWDYLVLVESRRESVRRDIPISSLIKLYSHPLKADGGSREVVVYQRRLAPE